MPREEKKGPVCFKCQVPVGSDMYCYGCRHYVCEKCDINPQVGQHDATDHLEDQELVLQVRP